jgi:hypothetical protein
MRVVAFFLSAALPVLLAAASAAAQGGPQAFAYEAPDGTDILRFDDPQSAVVEKVPPNTVLYSFNGPIAGSAYVEIDGADGGMLGYALASKLKPLGKKTVGLLDDRGNNPCRHC